MQIQRSIIFSKYFRYDFGQTVVGAVSAKLVLERLLWQRARANTTHSRSIKNPPLDRVANMFLVFGSVCMICPIWKGKDDSEGRKKTKMHPTQVQVFGPFSAMK